MANVLIADDEAELLELLRFSLDAAGYHITTAPDGKKALSLAKSQSFDLIVLDVMMPHVDGYHVAQELSGDPHSPPILLLTSRDFGQDQTAIKGSGASAFLSKPFEISELLNVVKSLISGNK